MRRYLARRARTRAPPTSRVPPSAHQLMWATLRRQAVHRRQNAALAQLHLSPAWGRAPGARQALSRTSRVRMLASRACQARTAPKAQQCLCRVSLAPGADLLALRHLMSAQIARLVQPAARELPSLRSATPARPRARQECPLASCVSLASTSLIPTQQHASFAWRPAIAPVMARPRQHHVRAGPIRMRLGFTATCSALVLKLGIGRQRDRATLRSVRRAGLYVPGGLRMT